MDKVIRIKNNTFESLIDTGRWTDTMDEIIGRLLANYKSTFDDKYNLNKKQEKGCSKCSIRDKKHLESQGQSCQSFPCDPSS